tara:strand:- start:210 stop:707 length:498 start_codon:yes stop_codon:yes gene_type:complete
MTMSPHRIGASNALRKEFCDEVIREVCEVYGVTRGELLGRRRTFLLVEARQMAMFILRELGATAVGVGTVFNRDHGTVLYATKKIRGLIGICKHTAKRFWRLKHLLEMNPDDSEREPAPNRCRVKIEAEVTIDSRKRLTIAEVKRRAHQHLLAGMVKPVYTLEAN